MVLAMPAAIIALRSSRAETDEPGAISMEVYVWQRADSPELRSALQRSATVASRCHFLGVEIGRSGGQWRVSRTTVPDDLLEGQGLVMRIGASLAGESWQPGDVLDRVLDEAQWMSEKPVAECQIDYDCPQRSLSNYRVLLETIQARFPAMRWTITALPSWLGEPDARDLFSTADGVVLQVHSLTLPEQPQRPVILCDPAAARNAVRRMAEFGIPFHVALNTYGCEVFFDVDHQVVDVVSEDIPHAPSPRAVRRSAGISEAVELAGLVAEWKRDPPGKLRGIVWYRLPLDSDRRNWQWITWQRVAAGTIPASELRLEARATESGAWDLVLENHGERDERLPEWIATGCESLVLDGLNGYESHATDRLVLADAAWPWLPPAGSLTIGWLRTADPSDQPEPFILPAR